MLKFPGSLARLSASCLISLTGLMSLPALAKPEDDATRLPPTVEEQRLFDASKSMPSVVAHFFNEIAHFSHGMREATSVDTLSQHVRQQGNLLWQRAVTRAKQQKDYDDRGLYWTRLTISKLLRQQGTKFPISHQQRQALLTQWEESSRGINEVTFSAAGMKKILLTGFDPFLLDRHINQSNPSGVAALMLDGEILTIDGVKTQIETVMIPVRFEDFDQGLIERTLTPYMQSGPNQVDMVVTVSMGRKDFDLERFPARRRATETPDNLNVRTGAGPTNPLPPLLDGNVHPGPEFVEFSLPVSAMQQAQGEFKIIDNHKIATLNRGEFEATTLAELNGETSVKGSGGQYLSNEISYRSIALRDTLGVKLPVGHVHTPRIAAFEPVTEKAIVEQLREMLRLASQTL